MKKAFTLFACIITICLTTIAQTSNGGFYAKVVGIKDGDTFEVLYLNQSLVVRLAHIDCPEKSQPFGKVAKKYASDLCFGKTVFINTNGKKDRYKRLIGLVVVGNNLVVNEEMVKAGYAWHFKKYSNNKKYAQLEQEAKANRRGLWADGAAIPPWQWRK